MAAHRQAIALAQARYEQDRENAEALVPCEMSIAIQEAVVARSRSSILLGNLGSAYGHTARIHRSLARQATSDTRRRAHLQQALHWYDLGLSVLQEVQAGIEGEGNWEVHPDSLMAERDALLQSVKSTAVR